MNGSNYNFISRIFHELSLGSKTVSKLSFDIEQFLYLGNDSSQTINKEHVFVSGLARSGTTALMEILYRTDKFSSLIYSDLPFLLAPNLWKKISNCQVKSEYIARAHNDGMLINNRSPEAFDEVFFKVFLNDNYIYKDRLMINKLTPEILILFNNYLHLIFKKNKHHLKNRYLSKNNNNILRLSQIIKFFPNSKVIITYRDPLEHALSLQNQHMHFSKIQGCDAFILKYMNWLGHHEFGLCQKAFYLNPKIFDRMKKLSNYDINFWLLSWLNYYSYVLENYSDTCILFSYKLFSVNPTKIINNLLQMLDIQTMNLNINTYLQQSRNAKKVDNFILSECMDVYIKLNNKCLL